MTVSLVVPTYDRLPALQATLPSFLALDDVTELIVVVDGSSDGTSGWLRQLEDPRLRVIEHGRNRGAPAARNTGLDASTGDWVMMVEDDVRLPPTYVSTLLACAGRLEADVLSAPWLHLPSGLSDAEVQAEVAQRRANAVSDISLATHPSAFPAAPTLTPFLNGVLLVRRRVLDAIRYDTIYDGNAYREETDFLVRAERSGFVCVLSPETYSLQAGQWHGGQRRKRLAYEWSTVRNNWRFLARHGDWLVARREIRGPIRAQAGFVIGRLHGLLAGRLSKALHR